MLKIPQSHPRAESLRIRELLVRGFKRGVVVPQGLIAQGRGETFDYIIGEKTIGPALKAIKASAAALLTAHHPVISVNGNVAALAAKEVVNLAGEIDGGIEVNLFHRLVERELAIKKLLEEAGTDRILGITREASSFIPNLESQRNRVDPRGIFTADVVLVPLEDGDRTEALRKMGKTVIAIDLNPLSRTARCATITIMDNVVRALPILIKEVKRIKGLEKSFLTHIIHDYDNENILKCYLQHIVLRLQKMISEDISVPEVSLVEQNV
jgi:4-phosphopantoate--beta-alanine ligase